MSTRAQTIEDLTDALHSLPGLSTRKMFGEYALYLNARVGLMYKRSSQISATTLAFR